MSLPTNVLPQKLRYGPRQISVGAAVNKVALGEAFVPTTLGFPCNNDSI
jgi:hypothetical protein